MYDLDKVYTKKFFKQRRRLVWRAPIVVSGILKVLDVRTIVDVGCGNGDIAAEFKNRGILAFGIEGTENALAGLRIPTCCFDVLDLRKPITHKRYSDLAICFEVAEHIENEYTDIFINNLCSLAPRVLFSAANLGQGGKYHVNCHSKEYWWYKFNARNYHFKQCIVDQIKHYWEPYRHKKGIKAFYQNLMYFERIDILYEGCGRDNTNA